MNNINEIRKEYMNNPPLGYSKEDIYEMSDEEILRIYDSMSESVKRIKYKCRNCGYTCDIPEHIVIKFDKMFGDTSFPPKFSCSNCHGGSMYPLYYKGVRGNTFKFGE